MVQEVQQRKVECNGKIILEEKFGDMYEIGDSELGLGAAGLRSKVLSQNKIWI